MWEDYDEDSARNLADECPCTAYYVEEGLRGCPVGITPTQAKADKDNFNKHKCNSTDLAIPSAQQAQGQSGTQSGKPDYSVTAFSVNGKSNDFSIDFNNQVKKSLFTFKYTFVNKGEVKQPAQLIEQTVCSINLIARLIEQVQSIERIPVQ